MFVKFFVLLRAAPGLTMVNAFVNNTMTCLKIAPLADTGFALQWVPKNK
jgi:hypothetical protein